MNEWQIARLLFCIVAFYLLVLDFKHICLCLWCQVDFIYLCLLMLYYLRIYFLGDNNTLRWKKKYIYIDRESLNCSIFSSFWRELDFFCLKKFCTAKCMTVIVPSLLHYAFFSTVMGNVTILSHGAYRLVCSEPYCNSCTPYTFRKHISETAIWNVYI